MIVINLDHNTTQSSSQQRMSLSIPLESEEAIQPLQERAQRPSLSDLGPTSMAKKYYYYIIIRRSRILVRLITRRFTHSPRAQSSAKLTATGI
jgi:hypothetical protein